jgi:hypothetical protein
MDKNLILNLSNLPIELILLLEILRIESDQESLILKSEDHLKNIDWEQFLQLSRHHRIYPSIYKIIKKMDNNLIPPFVIQKLYKLYQKNTYQMLYLSGEMEKVSKLFMENKVPSLFLKGPVLAFELYGDISLRTSSDLDILIPIHDLDKVDKLLFQEGYTKDDYILSVLNDWKWRHHHVTYFNKQNNFKLEIHWRLNPGPGKEPCFDELWNRKRISSLTKIPVYSLGIEDLFVFLVTHGARHGWSRLRWLEDINQIVKKDIDWENMYILLRNYQYLHLGGQALVLSSQLLSTEIIKYVELLKIGNRSKQLAQDALFYMRQMVNLHTDPVPEYVAKYHKHYLFALMSLKQKLLFIMSFFYPYHDDAKTLPLPKNIHFFYFFLRPFLWLWRKTMKIIITKEV